MSTTLTPTSYVVLGCVASAGSATPYELKAFVTESVGNFWSFPHSQLYSEPARLAEAGLLHEEREEAGRRRRRFVITDAGRDALAAWLAQPTDELPEIRDIALLKLFFSDLQDDAAALARLARAQHAAHAARVEQYEQMSAELAPGPFLSALQLGLAWEHVASTFWAELADDQ